VDITAKLFSRNRLVHCQINWTGTACSGAASATGKPVDVQVTLTDFKIDSSLTTFSTGVPYHFVVTNKGAVNHQFLIMPPIASPTTEQINQMMLAGIAGQGLAPGATQTVDYTFKSAPAGTLEFACHLPGHYDAGMHTPIVVK
jgi:uncharacterized cupredoxin-like copper-binding protein